MADSPSGVPAPDPFQSVVDGLTRDGFDDEAAKLDTLLHHVAWTTGSEMIGELGLEMKRTWPAVRRRGSPETKAAMKSAARIVRRAWPLFML